MLVIPVVTIAVLIFWMWLLGYLAHYYAMPEGYRPTPIVTIRSFFSSRRDSVYWKNQYIEVSKKLTALELEKQKTEYR